MVKQIFQHQTQISSINSIINKFRKTDDKIRQGISPKIWNLFLKNMKILRLKNTITEIKNSAALIADQTRVKRGLMI